MVSSIKITGFKGNSSTEYILPMAGIVLIAAVFMNTINMFELSRNYFSNTTNADYTVPTTAHVNHLGSNVNITMSTWNTGPAPVNFSHHCFVDPQRQQSACLNLPIIGGSGYTLQEAAATNGVIMQTINQFQDYLNSLNTPYDPSTQAAIDALNDLKDALRAYLAALAACDMSCNNVSLQSNFRNAVTSFQTALSGANGVPADSKNIMNGFLNALTSSLGQNNVHVDFSQAVFRI
ncbi:MAG: hypothetical protein K2X01_02680 [Cyanobacteria bacterium]|nr:hypothetical protein [Cyanobacteriota bacterium]